MYNIKYLQKVSNLMVLDVQKVVIINSMKLEPYEVNIDESPS